MVLRRPPIITGEFSSLIRVRQGALLQCVGACVTKCLEFRFVVHSSPLKFSSSIKEGCSRSWTVRTESEISCVSCHLISFEVPNPNGGTEHAIAHVAGPLPLLWINRYSLFSILQLDNSSSIILVALNLLAFLFCICQLSFLFFFRPLFALTRSSWIVKPHTSLLLHLSRSPFICLAEESTWEVLSIPKQQRKPYDQELPLQAKATDAPRFQQHNVIFECVRPVERLLGPVAAAPGL